MQHGSQLRWLPTAAKSTNASFMLMTWRTHLSLSQECRQSPGRHCHGSRLNAGLWVSWQVSGVLDLLLPCDPWPALLPNLLHAGLRVPGSTRPDFINLPWLNIFELGLWTMWLREIPVRPQAHPLTQTSPFKILRRTQRRPLWSKTVPHPLK